MPNMAAASPLSGWLPASLATLERPKALSANTSGVFCYCTSGRMTGIAAASTSAPNTPPIIEAE